MGLNVTTLVVMPHPRVLPLLRCLEECSVEVSWVSSRREAVNALRQRHEIDVVLTDAVLPDGDWRDVLDAVNGNAEVIVCAAQPERAFYCEVVQLGAYDVLSELEDPENVRKLLRAAAARRQMRRLSAALANRKTA